MAEHWSWLTGTEAGEYTYSPPTRPSRPPHRPLVKLATSAHLHTIARWCCHGAHYWAGVRMLWFFVFVAVALGSVRGDAEAMSHVTAHFGKTLEECREESGLTSELMEEFHHFWREDFDVVHRELGCAIICMSKKFSLLHDDAKLHHANMHDYIKSLPRGEILSEKMVELIHNCEKNFDDLPDECDRVVKTAACFKVNARKEGIAPEMTMMEAVLEKY